MKVIHLNTYDVIGGAARAAYRIHRSLVDNGIDSQMISRYKFSNDDTVQGSKQSKINDFTNWVREKTERAFLKRYDPLEGHMWSPAWLNNRSLINYLNNSNADIINLHWINLGYLSIRDIGMIKKPIVWTLHDMWPMTGGCHYAGTCTKYKKECNHCFQLRSRTFHDLSNSCQGEKKKKFSNIKRIISPSRWMDSCAKSSLVLGDIDSIVIHYGMNINIYKPADKVSSIREFYNLPKDKILILFPGYPDMKDRRKGFSLIIDAIKTIPTPINAELVVLGTSGSDKDFDLPLKVNYLKRLNDDFSLANLYSSCDFSLCSSTEDNLPNTVLESLSCGTPVIGFDIGGIPDMVDHEINGYLVKPFNVKEFGERIRQLCESKHILSSFSENSRKKIAKDFNSSNTSLQYYNMYNEIIEQNNF